MTEIHAHPTIQLRNLPYMTYSNSGALGYKRR